LSGEASATPLKVFINYRHDDTQGTAWALYLKLEERLGAENVFFDNGTLRPGVEWFDEIKARLAQSAAFIALIGPNWMSSLTARLQQSGEDYVVTELDLALRSAPQVIVIPVLVDDAEPPDPRRLPPALMALSDRHVERLRHTNLREDIDNLIARLDQISAGAEIPPADAGAPLGERRPPSIAAELPVAGERAIASPRVGLLPDEAHYRLVAGQAGNLVIFLGAGANSEDHRESWSAGSGGLPDDRDLAAYLAGQLSLEGTHLHLAEIAQRAGATYGEPELFEWITGALAVQSDPGPVHRYLASLPSRLGGRHQMIVTTKYDAALERAFKQAGEEYDVVVYMAPGTDGAGRFVHVPWSELPRTIDKPNEYTGLPIVAEDRTLWRTVIVRINGAIHDPGAGLPWEDNFVITEDHYIDFLSGSSPEQVVPAQILAKLKRSNYLFLGYSLADWRLRVFLQRIWRGPKLGKAKYWAVEREPGPLERDLWQQLGASLYESGLVDYLEGLDAFVRDHPGEPAR
jgi:SIR2-like domain/TIR domain